MFVNLSRVSNNQVFRLITLFLALPRAGYFNSMFVLILVVGTTRALHSICVLSHIFTCLTSVS